MQNSSNPLAKHFRQPKLYIRLPSRGNFYAPGSITIPDNGEFAVLAMTAKDELKLKTPDALLNGQSTVDVIQSCVPDIKNAWHVPSIDVDALLIAIRIATYGDKMEVNVPIPGINEERKYDVDLIRLLDTLNSQEYSNILRAGEFNIETAPLNYKGFTETALKTFEERRLFAVVNNDDMDESEKIKLFNQSFERITDLNIGIVSKSVVSISVDGEAAVTDPVFINEFFENSDKDVYRSVIEHIDAQRNKFMIKPFAVTTSAEDQERGAPAEFEIPISFDQSNFFA